MIPRLKLSNNHVVYKETKEDLLRQKIEELLKKNEEIKKELEELKNII